MPDEFMWWAVDANAETTEAEASGSARLDVAFFVN
jgi:hypothetical protein